MTAVVTTVAAGGVVFGVAVVMDVTGDVETEVAGGVEHDEELVLAPEIDVVDDAGIEVVEEGSEVAEREVKHAAVAVDAGVDAVVLAAASIEVYGQARNSTEGVPSDVKHEAAGDEQKAGLIVVFAGCENALPRNEFVEGGSVAPRNFEVDD